MHKQLKVLCRAVATSLGFFAMASPLVMCLCPAARAGPRRLIETNAVLPGSAPARGPNPAEGRKLFERNCAHCHGDNARGDEGPNLYNLRLSDAKIARRIKEGIPGEMPRFGTKLSDADVEVLIAYLRSLRG